MSKLPTIGGDFVRLVESYRVAERDYFRDRTRFNQSEVIRLCKLVDLMIERWNNKVGLLDAVRGQFTLIELPGAYVVGDASQES
jgi:hypothetical protein